MKKSSAYGRIGTVILSGDVVYSSYCRKREDKKMLYRNANIFDTEHGFFKGGFTVQSGRFTEIICGECDGDGTDLNGAYVIPGLIDIHVHGSCEADFSDGDFEGLERMSRYLARKGITSFSPASMTLPYEKLEKAFSTAKRFGETAPDGCSRLMGIHMEGPFFSEKKKGAQNGAYLRKPDFDEFRKLSEACGGLVKIVDVAPELEGAENFIRKASALCTVSVAHTDSDYDIAAAAFDAGSTHLTHLYNAMPPIHHRNPGVIGAASERENVTAELICDGFHVHPSAVRMAFRLFPGRICLISDALRCCGMPEGEYMLGGQKVFMSGGIAKLEDGTIAGSATNLYCCMMNAISFGIDRDAAIRAATSVPAKEIGAENETGSISVGKLADFVVCDSMLNIKRVFIGGKPLE